jgi:hypothetical protein
LDKSVDLQVKEDFVLFFSPQKQIKVLNPSLLYILSAAVSDGPVYTKCCKNYNMTKGKSPQLKEVIFAESA